MLLLLFFCVMSFVNKHPYTGKFGSFEITKMEQWKKLLKRVWKNVGDGFYEMICIYIRSAIILFLSYQGNVWVENCFYNYKNKGILM